MHVEAMKMKGQGTADLRPTHWQRHTSQRQEKTIWVTYKSSSSTSMGLCGPRLKETKVCLIGELELLVWFSSPKFLTRSHQIHQSKQAEPISAISTRCVPVLIGLISLVLT